MHLAVRPSRASKRPPESVVSDEVRHHLDIFFGVRAQRGKLAVPDPTIRVQLQGRAREYKRHYTVQIEIAAEARGGVVEKPGRARLIDAIHHPLDEARGFILFRKAQAETGHGLRDIEGLPVVVVVAAMQKRLV